MQIYVAHASHFNYHEELYRPIINSELNDHYTFIFPHLNTTTPEHSRDIIAACSYVIAEVSFASTGMGIELGWANDLNIPIICLHQTEKKPSTSLKLITNTFIEYHSPAQMMAKLASVLPNPKR